MDFKIITLFAVTFLFAFAIGANEEDIPYQNVEHICKTCMCEMNQESRKHDQYMLSCNNKKFQHILARWPEEFGADHAGMNIVAIFSGNAIGILQQIPATNASLTLVCQHCSIKKFQVPTFMDVPNIKILDLSFNNIITDELTPDVFRGPYHTNRYEPIALTELSLSFNKLHALDKKLFEHTPFLKKLILSHNDFTVLDNPTIIALSSVHNLELLDLCHTGLKSIPAILFKTLFNLKTLNLAGNKLTMLPGDWHHTGQTLQILNLASNEFKQFSELDFTGLTVLRKLNISSMSALQQVTEGTFKHLKSLEYLHTSHNPKLNEFDLESLLPCKNLTWLDISKNNLNSITLHVNIRTTNDTSIAMSDKLWPRLRVFLMAGNPWLCDCNLLQTLDLIGLIEVQKEERTRCSQPFQFSGALLSNLTSSHVCALNYPPKFRIIEEEPTRFLRKSYILRMVGCIAVVLALGVAVGFLVVYIRRGLKRDEFGVEPIRYTSVRSSNLSAISQLQTNGHRISSLTTNNGHINT